MTAHAAKTVRLLVAEDNPLVRDLIQKGLDPHCEVVIAEDGGDALLKVIDEPPDVILCDYKMPGLNGGQLFEKLRGREQRIVLCHQQPNRFCSVCSHQRFGERLVTWSFLFLWRRSSRRKSPLFPPVFSTRYNSAISMLLSSALHMSYTVRAAAAAATSASISTPV